MGGTTNPPAPHVDGLFRQPTDVAWDSEGNTYITDGYVNSRVAKFDQPGRVGDVLGRERNRARTVQSAACDRDRPCQSDLCRRSIEQADSGVRPGRTISTDVHHRRANPTGYTSRSTAIRRAASARPLPSVRQTRSASRRGRTRYCSLVRARSRGASSRWRSTGECSASSAGPAVY